MIDLITTTASDFVLAGGISCALNICSEPFHRTFNNFAFQDANPRIVSGEEKRLYGVIDSAKSMYQREGIKVFLPRLNKIAASSSLLRDGGVFAIKDLIKEIRVEPYRKSEYTKAITHNIQNAMMAGAIAHAVTYPLTQVGFSVSGGVRNMYKGFRHSTLPSMVFFGTYIGLYDSFRYQYPAIRTRRRRGASPLWKLSWNASLSLITSTAAVFIHRPFEVVRLKMKLSNTQSAFGINKKYINWLGCLITVSREEGIHVLLRGLSIGRIVPAALLLSLYDICRQIRNDEFLYFGK